MDDCFSFFAPILNGIAFEFSKCYLQCSKETKKVEHLQANIRNTYAKDGEEKDIKTLGYAVEKCRNASKRAFVEKTFLTYHELQDCILPTDNDSPTPVTNSKRNYSQHEAARALLFGGNQETTKAIYSEYQRRHICDID